MPPFFARLGQDPLALLVLAVLILIQFWSWHRWALETRTQLKQQSDRLTEAQRTVRTKASAQDIGAGSVSPEVDQALRIAFPTGAHDEAVDPRVAFDPERLLPRAYNARLDAAAPGMFTAIGIVGTFLGLILAFRRLDFGNAAQSIDPLIGGMTISFLNSLVGVVLSIRWTVSSRRARHLFDNSARDLLAEVEKRFARPAYGTQVLGALVAVGDRLSTIQEELRVGMSRAAADALALRVSQETTRDQIASELRELNASTQGASRDLLDSLAPRLEATFQSVIALPFDRLGESVEKFRNAVDETARRSEVTLAAIDQSAEALRAAQGSLEHTTTLASEATASFATGVQALQQGAEEAAAVVRETQNAAVTLHNAADEFTKVGEQNQRLATALDGAVAHLQVTSGSIGDAAAQFAASAVRMEAAAEHIQRLGQDAAEHSVETVRKEITEAVAKMAESLHEFSDRSVAAYESSSARLIDALDEHVTDLTERLSAELQTLAQRLPDSAAEITRAADVLRRKLEAAVRDLKQATQSLDASTTQALASRLEQYDRLVAQAVDRFSGTLLTWDGKLSELGKAGRELGEGVAAMQRDAGTVLTGAHGAAEAAAKAAADASRAIISLETAMLRLAQAPVGGSIAPAGHVPPAIGESLA